MRIKSLPHISQFRKEESGIKRVVEAYAKYLPQFDIETLDPKSKASFDLLISHAGMGDGTADVAHLHGLYWTADYEAPLWEYDSNRRIVNDLRIAKQITVPSHWVAETIQRDMRLNPHVIGHGIEWQEWQHNFTTLKYVLWNKNRTGDVCSPADVNRLARDFPNIQFVSTFGNGANIENRGLDEFLELVQLEDSPNYFNIGLRHHDEMKQIIQQAGVYLSTTKETFGIGILEAMAAGLPILGYNHGGNVELVQHGVNGYLAQDYEDLCEGLVYCIEHHKTLGDNSREMAKQWTWYRQVEKVAGVYRLATVEQKPDVSVIIPVYKKTIEEIKRAIDSCLNQTLQPKQIIIIQDGCPDNSGSLAYQDYMSNPLVRFVEQSNQGVAIARNNGIELATTKYVCCLDADDWLDINYLKTCVDALESDKSLSIAYTGLQWHKPDGTTGLSEWPGNWNYDKHLQKQNQIPTCCVFKRDMWQRLGGYRQRYAPQGAGAEDAEFWLRAGAYGFKAAKVSNEGLFHYSWLSGQVTGNKDYREVDWRAWHPWVIDGKHPFISFATPQQLSHPVRQYDNPVVSVIIPVGPGHENEVFNALDSLEAQTFRQWECIVVWDNNNIELYDLLHQVYPYIKWKINWIDYKGWGAGYARNRGVEKARAPLLLFLDADDTLHPEALEYMIDAWNNEQKIIYSDYVGQAFIEPELANKLDKENRLQSYNSKDGEAIISYKAFDFDCNRALLQPDNPPYIWCNITSLFPKKWHDEIGGFDESLETWEDWDYWIRHVFNGKCFYHLEKELLRYRFYTGQRREIAASDRQKANNMLELLKDKYKGIDKTMGCTSCGGNKPQVQIPITERQAIVADDNYIRAKWIGQKGNHHVQGVYELDFDPGVASRRKGNKWVHYYGYNTHHLASKGTLVFKEDFRLMVGKWERLPEVNVPKIETVKPIPQVLEAPKPIVNDNTLDLQSIPGVTDKIAAELIKAKLTTKEAILKTGIDGLLDIKGIAQKRAEMIINYLEK